MRQPYLQNTRINHHIECTPHKTLQSHTNTTAPTGTGDVHEPPQKNRPPHSNPANRRRFGDSVRREAVFFEATAPYYRGAWSPLLIMSEGNYLDTLSAFIIAVEEEDYAKRKRMVDALSEQSNASESFVRKYTNQYESLEFLLMTNKTFEVLTAECDLLELALALRAYEQTHGTFPETLADLTPEFLPVLPQDPLNGKAYCYEKTAELITIRSEETTENGDEIAFHLAPLAQVAGTPEGQ